MSASLDLMELSCISSLMSASLDLMELSCITYLIGINEIVIHEIRNIALKIRQDVKIAEAFLVSVFISKSSIQTDTRYE
jgi:hypothetical protein